MALRLLALDLLLIVFLFSIWTLYQLRLIPNLTSSSRLGRFIIRTSDSRHSGDCPRTPGAVAQLGRLAGELVAQDVTESVEVSALTPQGCTNDNDQQKLVLLLCVDNGGLDTELVQLDISSITDDCDLLTVIRESRADTIGLRRRLFSFRRVGYIRLVQFKVYRSSEDELLRWAYALKGSVTAPEQGTTADQSYIVEPTSSNGEAPIASETLVRWFRQPERCQNATNCIRAFPKLNSTLTLRPGATEVTGWGVHLMEEEDHTKWAWLAVLLCLSSLVPGLAVYITKRDLSGAFGVSAYTLPILLAIAGTMKLWL